MPNGLTLFNLFCGVYAIILAIRGDFASAPAFIVLGGIADTLDGRVARATGTGSRFGEELDSLVDAISFGLAPALITFMLLQQQPNHGRWEWLFVFIFASCAVMRLARFNVEQAGRKKTHFHGLPSPAAGLTLATYFWFSQTSLYNKTVILFTDSKTLATLPWHSILPGLMAVLAALMVSDVPYPTVPSVGFGSIRKLFGTLVVLTCLFLLVFRRGEFLFPALIAYVFWGVIKWVVLGLLGRSHTPTEVYGSEPKLGAIRPDGERRTPLRGTPIVGPKAVEPGRDLRTDERSDRPDRADRTPRLERGDRPERAERPDRSERAQREPRADDSSPARRKRRRRGRGSRPPNASSESTSPDSTPPNSPPPGALPKPAAPFSPPPDSPAE